MARATAAGLVVLAFASGAATGVVVERTRARPAPDALRQPTRHEKLDALAALVGLDPEQRKKVEEISDRNHDRVRQARAQADADLAVIRSDVRAQMRAVMNDEQRKRYDAFCERYDGERAAADR